MKWHKEIARILRSEPEVWLAYLYGQKLDSIPHLTRKKTRIRGVALRILVFFHYLLKNTRLTRTPLLRGEIDYLVYAGTINQISALDTTIDALRDRDAKVMAITKRPYLSNSERRSRYAPYHFSLLDAVQSVWLLATRGLALYRELKKQQHPAAIDLYFNAFCYSYIYLTHFYRILEKSQPKIVVTANDHNVANRCLLAVAHHLGIKTVYLQHASVSALFPALRVNYAFLDGQAALATYRLCEPNQPKGRRNVPVPIVFLTGQKKSLKDNFVSETSYVGVAVNPLDKTKKAIQLARFLAEAGLNVCLRWHPAQSAGSISRYKEALMDRDRILLSDPRAESVAEFLSRLTCIVAGNSSILLEAALLDIQPFYFELNPPDVSDYYGYVKNGLAKQVYSEYDLLELLKLSSYKLNEKAVRYYSATYQTEWEGREGELVAECLQRLSSGEKPPVEAMRFEKDVAGVVNQSRHVS